MYNSYICTILDSVRNLEAYLTRDKSEKPTKTANLTADPGDLATMFLTL